MRGHDAGMALVGARGLPLLHRHTRLQMRLCLPFPHSRPLRLVSKPLPRHRQHSALQFPAQLRQAIQSSFPQHLHHYDFTSPAHPIRLCAPQHSLPQLPPSVASLYLLCTSRDRTLSWQGQARVEAYRWSVTSGRGIPRSARRHILLASQRRPPCTHLEAARPSGYCTPMPASRVLLPLRANRFLCFEVRRKGPECG